MGNRALQMVTLIVAVAVGGGAAYGVRAVRNVSSQQASSTSSTPGASPSASTDLGSSPSPTASPSDQASPSPAESPTLSPPPAPTRPAAGAAAYPAQLQAGSTYSYSGSGQLAALASDGQDSGTSICAGITNTTQFIPNGYLAAYFVSVTFRDGQVLSAGYVRKGSTSNDFGELQSGSSKPGNKSSSATSAGTHTYCVARSGSAWVMTADGGTVASTTAEPATSTSGATLHFESTIQRVPGSSAATVALGFVVPGFQNISINGRPATQLKGATVPF